MSILNIKQEGRYLSRRRKVMIKFLEAGVSGVTNWLRKGELVWLGRVCV